MPALTFDGMRHRHAAGPKGRRFTSASPSLSRRAASVAGVTGAAGAISPAAAVAAARGAAATSRPAPRRVSGAPPTLATLLPPVPAPRCADAPSPSPATLLPPPAAGPQSHAELCLQADSLARSCRSRLGFWAGHGIEHLTAAGALLVLPVSLGMSLGGVPLASVALVGISAGIVACCIAVGIAVELLARRRQRPLRAAMRLQLEDMAGRLEAARRRARGARDAAQVHELDRACGRVAAALAAVEGGPKNVLRAVGRGLAPGAVDLGASLWARLRG